MATEHRLSPRGAVLHPQPVQACDGRVGPPNEVGPPLLWRLKRHLFLLTAALILASLVGCRGFQAEAPTGFAAYATKNPYRAASPDGVMFRVRLERNEPQAELSFWKEALKKRMVDAGYRFVAESDIKAGEKPGYLLELSAPLGTQDYTYLIGLFENERKLVIVESAGEVSRFAARRDAVLEAIGKVRIN